MKVENLKILPIKKIVKHCETIKTFYFDYKLNAKPGQYVWLWLPGVAEKPFSVGCQTEKEFGLTICQVGETTEKIFKLQVGDKIGIKGPYGTNFNIKEAKNIALVGGGYGSAPLSFLAKDILKNNKNIKIDFLIGARTKELIFTKPEEFKNINFHFTTNDGSLGAKGRVTETLEELLKKGGIDYIATCGPELMQLAIVDLAEKYNVACQISLERYMKCSNGICGQCVVEPLGIRMCKEGPVISRELARKISEFGVFHRGPAGEKIYFNK